MLDPEPPADGDGGHDVEVVVGAGQVLVVDEVVFIDNLAVIHETDEVVAAARMQSRVHLRAENAGVAFGLVALHPAGDVLVVAVID